VFCVGTVFCVETVFCVGTVFSVRYELKFYIHT